MSDAFCPCTTPMTRQRMDLQFSRTPLTDENDEEFSMTKAAKFVSTIAVTAAISASIMIGVNSPALAENELSAKYGGTINTSLVDQNCLVDKCSLQAQACLADDPECRKGLICTAKCTGDTSCVTGCMARYGDKNLDNLLKCTIEDNECIKVAILDGGNDKFGQEPKPPAPTVRNFDMNSLQGQWYKVVGFNPNYDCYACQKNTFSPSDENTGIFKQSNKLEVNVQFSMARMLPDGTPPPPKLERENVERRGIDGVMYGSQSIGFNDYQLREVMVFDKSNDPKTQFSSIVLGKGTKNEASYSRTAHSEGDMFGLKFWENWYIIGENDPGEQEFKFVYYNGKTRQNTYDGAFVYSRTKELDMTSMKKVYKIASDAGMNPDQFCKIRNGCFKDEVEDSAASSPSKPFRGILASTKISEILGVEPVAAEGVLSSTRSATDKLRNSGAATTDRKWWNEVGDYLENPHRHFEVMDSLRDVMIWPEEVRNQ